MLKFNILTEGFKTANGIGFLYPIIFNAHRLAELGIKVQLFTSIKKPLYLCDVLGVESKFFHRIFETVTPFLENTRKRLKKIIWFETTDSTSCVTPVVIPYVDSYCKFQILKEKAIYMNPLYGNRIWLDFFHRNFCIEDNLLQLPGYLPGENDLSKIRVSWSPGLADYSLMSPVKNSFLKRLPIYMVQKLLPYPHKFVAVRKNRPVDISCRVSVYKSALLSYQRQKLIDKLKKRGIDTDKISRKKYFLEMENSKLSISPFGWGEVTLRDFEAFLSGSILMKPDMQHLETWPDFYQANKTVVFFKWDLSDLEEQLDKILNNYKDYAFIAEEAQNTYKKYTLSDEGRWEFCNRLKEILTS